MKILVYGAGVLGCNLARNLLRAGKDVTLLARGNWAAEIKQNGLRIKDKFSPRTSVSRIPVVTALAPDAAYDVIFVVLRYTQLDSALNTLRENQTKNIVFVGNNVRARALAAALPEASARERRPFSFLPWMHPSHFFRIGRNRFLFLCVNDALGAERVERAAEIVESGLEKQRAHIRRLPLSDFKYNPSAVL